MFEIVRGVRGKSVRVYGRFSGGVEVLRIEIFFLVLKNILGVG